jgi:hypothetical protein
LTKGRLLNGKCGHCRFRGFFNTVLGIGFPPIGINQGIDTLRRHSRLIAIKGITRKTQHLAGA